MALTSMYAGLSGLNANALQLSLIGNNISNSNTVGYKSSSATFQDLLSQTLSGGSSSTNPLQVGLGTTAAGTSMNFSQGSLQTTGINSHMAIQGGGFFVVNNGEGNSYTRAGNFNVDAKGNLVTADGLFVQGYTQKDPATNKIMADGALSNITIPPGTLFAPTATTSVRLISNLDANATSGTVFTSSMRVVDSLGSSHQLNYVFTKGANPGEWSYDITVDGGEVTGGTAGTAYSLIGAAGAPPTAPAGTMVFDATGKLSLVDGNSVLNATPPPLLDPAVAPIPITTPTFSNGASEMSFTWDVAKADSSASYTSYLTGYGAPSATSSSAQNGFAAGSLSSFTVAEDGTVQGIFSNGQTAELARIALVTFNNPAGLLKTGSNNYSASTSSGEPSIGGAAAGGRGKIAASSLELSNVDIASEFINMIIAQRGYQANSRVISITDQVTQESINLVR